METFTTRAVYKDGVVIPAERPREEWGEVFVTFLPAGQKKITKKKLEQLLREDERVWKRIGPSFKKIRKELGKKYYPQLYEK